MGTFSGIMNPSVVHGRTLRMWCTEVSSDEGFLRVQFDGFPGQGRATNIPFLWASFPPPATENQKRYGAWGRYIPFERDLLKIGFDYNDDIHVLGYDTKYFNPNASAEEKGWGLLTEKSVGDDPSLLSQFRVLNSGEYDFMSIGGAYIWGSNKGNLHLEGGPAQIDLSKSMNSINATAQTWKLNANASTIRYGQVKRFAPTMTESGIGEVAATPWNPPPWTNVEHQILLQQIVTPSPVPLAVVRHAMGNVTTNPPIGGGIPDISTTTGQLKRFAFDVFDTSGLIPVYQDEVDMLGSQTVSAAMATQFNVIYPLGTVKFMSASSQYNTSADTKVTTGTSFDAIVGTAYSLTTIGGGVSIRSGFETIFTSALGTTINAGASLALSGATASITAGGMTFGMSSGVASFGAGLSSSLNYTPFNTTVQAASINPLSSLSAAAAAITALEGTILAPAGTAMAFINNYLIALNAALKASENITVKI